jgi:hypothetical protein
VGAKPAAGFGWGVPLTVAVIRFLPFITVVAQPAYDIGKQAVQHLIERLEHRMDLPPRVKILPTRLIMRYSSMKETSPFSLRFPEPQAVKSGFSEPYQPLTC